LSSRKGETTARMNERDYPHIVELPLPSGGFRAKSDDIMAIHRERGIEPRRGRGWHDDEQYYVCFCFADPAHARESSHPIKGGRQSVLGRASAGLASSPGRVLASDRFSVYFNELD
jgi:hypothetical protein